MEELKIIENVEKYLNGEIPQSELNGDLVELKDDLGRSSSDEFVLHTVNRLISGFELFQEGKCGVDDFLLVLRDYLLVLQTDIRLNLDIPSDNKYGISRDSQSGRWFATYQLPEYVKSSFVEAAFVGGSSVQEGTAPQDENNLVTDPLIYHITGFRHFKTMAQKLAVYGALTTPPGYTTLVALPTGGGKSLITQTLAYQGVGLTIVVVPTVSLAMDQMRIAKEVIRSENDEKEIFSYSSGVNADPILDAIKRSTAKLLFISPEALIENSDFVREIERASQRQYLKNIIIDEAHIVVDWGASFRVDYQCLESWRRKLLGKNPYIRTVLLSATFEERCVQLLKKFFSQDGQKWIEIRCDSLRREPRFMVVKSKSIHEKNERLLELVRTMPHPMIIYVPRPVDAAHVARLLKKNGIQNIRTFTGRTRASERRKLIDEWADDQFEVMVATSAFGIGVDKKDVRTVIHMYVPENPNVYYQELGRGGRDGLPCLSIMCIYEQGNQSDFNAAFDRFRRAVLTAEKIIGRWNSMYNDDRSERYGELIGIDTTIKPAYAEKDILDDALPSDADQNWNIYVLLFLRRNDLIKIREVIHEGKKYIFVIEIVDNVLRTNDDRQREVIENLREKERKYYEDELQSMTYAVKNADKECLSDMFCETYEKVSEYCAGCNAHDQPSGKFSLGFPLKSAVRQPVKEIAPDQESYFSGNQQIVVLPDDLEMDGLLQSLGKLRISAMVFCSESEAENVLTEMDPVYNVLILDPEDFRQLLIHGDNYYISGIVVVKYSGDPNQIYDLLKFIEDHLLDCPSLKIIHVVEENIYFDWIDKNFRDFINGPLIPAKNFSA